MLKLPRFALFRSWMYGSHWLTVSNIQCNGNTIKIYYSKISTTLEASEQFNCQVANLLNCQTSSVRVEYANIKQQRGSDDCGLFAITCATSLCFGLSPETQNFIQGELRAHLANCFVVGEMTPFTAASSPLLSKNSSISYEIPICSKCRLPKHDGKMLIECMMCNSL